MPVKHINQLLQILRLMGLPENVIKAIRKESETALSINIKNNAYLLAEKEKESKLEDAKLLSIEEKRISGKINHDTYQRWYERITNNRTMLTSSINRLSQDQSKRYLSSPGHDRRISS